MKTRVMHTKVWKDEWFISLSQDARFLWLYLLTCDKINISGIFELSDREIVFDTGINAKSLENIKKELEPKAIFYKGFVKITNVDRYNNYKKSPKNVIASNKELNYLSTDIRGYLDTNMHTSIDTSIDTPRNTKQEIRNTKQETNGEQNLPWEILDELERGAK